MSSGPQTQYEYADNPELDLEFEKYKEQWDRRFGLFNRKRFYREETPESIAEDWQPDEEYAPEKGHPAYLPPPERTWGDSAFTFIGYSFLGGGLAGFATGLVKSLKTSKNLPWKLKVNSILNLSGRHGRTYSNGLAGCMLAAYGVAYMTEHLRRRSDELNYILSGTFLGALVGSQRISNPFSTSRSRRKTQAAGTRTPVAAKTALGALVGTAIGFALSVYCQIQVGLQPFEDIQRTLGTNYFPRNDTRYWVDGVDDTSYDVETIEGEFLEDTYDRVDQFDDDDDDLFN
eukprot:CAMPEP_0201552228 /NCGR_PEP_ID=MMETSP0173_2-20130828/14568_1 /ASSEMBLY_ACC=CAM_ASM_000268 /TAXON_ID=218659 /ORGANISM="Vexillifera sp., Strain DIVA3 564/2" /LENGTH=287 /DNA_ID=CAMNT_0047962671 /DNA_START=25 /DNA_END=886 /DNA_ORIENTATION=-